MSAALPNVDLSAVRPAKPAAESALLRGIDLTIEAILIGLVAFCPFAFGGVEAWSELVVFCGAAALLFCLALRFIACRDAVVVGTRAYIPIALVLLIAGAQLLPLPASLVSKFSANTVRLKHDLLSDASGSASPPVTVSFYPQGTRHDFAVLASMATVFVAAAHVYRRGPRLRRMLISVAAIGGAVALLALAQDLTGTKRLYWIGPLGRGRATAGPFIHYSHFSQFMNLTIGAVVALLLLALNKAFSKKGFDAKRLLRGWQAHEFRAAWLLVALIALAVTTIFLSMSRGAMVALFVSFAFATACLSRVRGLPGRGWVLVPLALAIFGGLLAGFESTINRLATLSSESHYTDRIQILKDLTHLYAKYPVFGTGLGSHEFVYPMFDRSHNMAVATHAENEYAQVTEEMGFVGLALVLAFATVVWVNFARALRYATVPRKLVAVGLGFGVMAVTIHSLSDFGPHVPANAVLTSIFCGVLVSLGHAARASVRAAAADVPRAGFPLLARVFAGMVAFVAFAAFGFYCVREGNTSRRAERFAKAAEKAEDVFVGQQWQGDNAQFVTLINAAAAAADLQPGNVRYRYLLAYYRWAAISRVHDANGNVLLNEAGRAHTAHVVADLLAARVACPVYGPLYSLAGQLESSVLGDNDAALRHLRDAFKLAPCDPGACLASARQEAVVGNWNTATAALHRYLEMSSSFGDVIGVFVGMGHKPELAMALAHGDSGRLTMLSTALARDNQYGSLAAQAHEEALALLRERCAKKNAVSDDLIQLATQDAADGEFDDAIECYRRAIAQDYGQLAWHLALADLLVKTGRADDAEHEARICLRLHPQDETARQLVASLSIAPRAKAE